MDLKKTLEGEPLKPSDDETGTPRDPHFEDATLRAAQAIEAAMRPVTEVTR